MLKQLSLSMIVSLLSFVVYADDVQTLTTEIKIVDSINEKKICGMTKTQAYHQILFDASPEERMAQKDEFREKTDKAYQGDLESLLYIANWLYGYEKTDCILKFVAEHDNENGKMARYALARYYGNGFHDFPEDKEKQFYWLEKLAEIDPEAYYTVGFSYDFATLTMNPESETTQRYAQRALYWYLKASQAGNTSASYKIAHLYSSGRGVEHDIEKAVQWLNTTIEQSLAIMQSDNKGSFEEHWILHKSYEELGDFYFENKDYTKAVEYYLGDINTPQKSHASHSYYMMGQIYENGFGVTKDIKKSKNYYKKACKEGVKKACQSK